MRPDELDAILAELNEARLMTVAPPAWKPDPLQVIARHVPALVAEVRRLRASGARLARALEAFVERGKSGTWADPGWLRDLDQARAALANSRGGSEDT